MPVKYTTKTISYSNTIRSDTYPHMVADIDTVLSPVALARAAVTGGWKYTMQSPDGLQMKIWVQNLGDHDEFHDYLRITPTSADETITGDLGFLWVNGDTYEAWANICQFFIARNGDTITSFNFACGVLALPVGSGPCTINGSEPIIDQLWWDSAGNNAFDFRNCRYANLSFTLVYNSTVINVGSGQGPLCMLPLCQSLNVDWEFAGIWPFIERYISGNALHIDTLVGINQQIYGQLWDAFTYTAPLTLDTHLTLTDDDSNGNPFSTTWLSWNNNVAGAGAGTTFGTLMLLLTSPSASVVQNFSY